MLTDDVPGTNEPAPETTTTTEPAPVTSEDAAPAEAAGPDEATPEAAEAPAEAPVAPASTKAVEADAEPAEAAPAQASSNKHWYVVKVQSGREETIKEAIERKVKIEGLEEYFGQIYVPSEKVTEMRNGKRYTRTRKVLPGYIMAEVEYNDRILYLFRETSGVGDFVGGTLNKPPPPMAPHEVAKWFKTKDAKSAEEPTLIKPEFEKGDRLKVKDGMFAGMEGEVKEIVEAKNLVKLELTIFGRPVIVELEYWQVEPV
jgi:transcriptional antiterminator NusG